MTGAQRFLQIILPQILFDALRSGTQNWLLECPCGHKRDLWNAGGVKGGAAQQNQPKRSVQSAGSGTG
jgi:hypothetical protein